MYLLISVTSYLILGKEAPPNIVDVATGGAAIAVQVRVMLEAGNIFQLQFSVNV